MYDLKVKDGGTVFLGNTEEKVYDSDSIFQRIEICLSLNKGDFIYNKNLGSTVLPWLSVRRPSSRICSKMLNTSG